MGLGMLGALGGLGDAGMQIGGQMMQSALRQDERKNYMDLLQQERDRVEKVQAQKRAEIGKIISSATSGKVDAEGPPTEDGQMPQRQMNEREKMLSSADALGKAGYLDEAVKYQTLAQKDAATEATLGVRRDIQEQTNEIRRLEHGRKTRQGDARIDIAQARLDGKGGAGGSGGGRSSSSSRSGGGKDSDIADLKDTETRIGKITDDIFAGDSGKAVEPSTRLSIQSNAIKYAGLNKGLDAAKAVDLAMKVQSGDIKPANQLGFNEQGVLVSTETVDGYQLSRPVAIRSKEAAAKYMASLIGDEEFMSDLAKKDSEFISNFVRNGKLKALSAQSGLSSNDIENILLNGIDRFSTDRDQKENASRHNIGREGRGMLSSAAASKSPATKQNDDGPATQIGPAVGRGVDAVGQFFKDQTRRSATADELLARRGK